MSTTNGGNRFNYTTVTIEVATPSEPTISIAASDGLTGGGIQLTPSITGSYITEYFYATVRNYNNANTQTYYWTSTTEATTTQPTGISDWSDATLSWEVTTGGAYASVNNDGLVTITANPTGNVVVTLTVTNGDYVGTQTYTLTRAAVAASSQTLTELSDIAVSPETAVLSNGQSQVFTATAMATTTTVSVPAHTSLTGDGATFYYYNGTLYASAADFGSDPVVSSPSPDGISYTWTVSALPAGASASGQNTASLAVSATSLASPLLATATATVTMAKNGVSATRTVSIEFSEGYTHVSSLSDLGASGYYILDADIDASSFSGNITFTGTLDGGYHTISGLTQPLFTTVNGGTVKNVVFDQVHIASGSNVGAVCGTATGNAKIYNCGVLNSDGTSAVTGSTNVGGLVGLIATGSNVRVVNCYNYATVSGGTYVAGIVGRNQGTISGTTTVNATGVRITNCMMYGDMTSGTYRSPVYGGNHTDNVQKLTEYNYYRSRANISYTVYNDQLAIDKDEFLTRFPFYRHIQNTHREMAAYFLFGAQPTAAQVDEIGHWVLKPDVAPYPIIEAWEENTRRTTVDRAANLPQTTEAYAGRLLTEMGTDGYLTVNVTINGSSYTSQLPITDMDTLAFDFTWGKVVLPFANEYSGWTRDYSKICTGWKITSVTGGTTGSLTNYNFADRDCTAKDIYNETTNPYIFAQGGNYIVPYGVTAINIEANFANAFYLSDARSDFGYNDTYEGQTNLGWAVPTTYHGQTVYTNLTNLVNALSNSTNPHSQAIVLVGNYHYNLSAFATGTEDAIFNTGKAVTIMSVDEDNNQEPDYGMYTYHSKQSGRLNVPPMRFDFLPNIGIGMAKRVTGSTPYPSIGIWYARGWFELTETCVSFMSECEIQSSNFTANDNGYGNNRWIANSGYFIQIVRNRKANCTKLSYLQIGGNAYVEELYPGSHTDQANTTTIRPIVVTGGEIEECYMTGYKAGATATGNNIYFWGAGGRIHKWLGAYLENPSTNGVNVTAKIDHAIIRRFFGGGTSQTARITGNIDITMNNSLVDFYCGGPEFGNMADGKTVTTHASGTTFGEYYGAGFGGTSITYNREIQSSGVEIGSNAVFPHDFATQVYKRLTYNASYGIGSCYKFEYIFYAGGRTAVARSYTGYAAFDLATTGSVTNVLDNCTVLRNFYGGGCQGKVNGTVTSTLTGCTVVGSAFGGGYKAAANTLDVYPATQPTYSVYTKETGLFSDFGTVEPETFTWHEGTEGASSDANKILYTPIVMSELGNVEDVISLTIEGGTVGVDVFGGGNESPSRDNTTVTLKGDASVGNNVFGGGNAAVVDGSTYVLIIDSTNVNGNVYGGGNMGQVAGDTKVVVGN